jgi:hypothetical protein
MHIDNIAPTADLSEEFESWHWYVGEDTPTIEVRNISELLDEANCKVYDNGKELDFKYSPESESLTFTPEEGWHNVGIKLMDRAGNSYDVQEKENIHIGFFWLWMILLLILVMVVVALVIVYYLRKRREVDID